MVRVCLTSLVLLFMFASTFSQYYPRSPLLSYDGYYGRTSYPQTSYRPKSYSRISSRSSYLPAYPAVVKTSLSPVSSVPLCKAGGQILLKVFVEKDYKPVSNAKVSYVDDKGMKTVPTDQYGYASKTVYGCGVALMVYHKEDNPVYKTVNLLSCTSREEKVVIKVDDKCNFNLKFTDKDTCTPIDESGDEHQLVSFTYNSTAVHTGYEEVVGKTVCITAGEVGEKLKVVLTSQYANIFNVLETTITSERVAVMARPPQLNDDEKQFDVVLISNTRLPGSEIVIHYDWYLYADDGSKIDWSDSSMSFNNHYYGGVYEGELAGKKWSLFGMFYIISALNLEGNVFITDRAGNYQTVEHPDEEYEELDDYFLVGCFCNNAPSMKAGDFFPIGKYIPLIDLTATPYATHCKQICDNSN